jgi:uncharacterized protein YukE
MKFHFINQSQNSNSVLQRIKEDTAKIIQTWAGSEDSRRLRHPDFETIGP